MSPLNQSAINREDRLVSSQSFLMFISNAVGHTTLLSPLSFPRVESFGLVDGNFTTFLVPESENRAALPSDRYKGKNGMLILTCVFQWNALVDDDDEDVRDPRLRLGLRPITYFLSPSSTSSFQWNMLMTVLMKT